MEREINKRYLLLKELGSGAMGSVYLAKDTIYNDQLVALKRIKDDGMDATSIHNFKNEFEIMTRLKHPNLIQVFDFGLDRDTQTFFITMEYVNGITLAQKTVESPIKKEKLLDIIVDICRAVEFMHSRNIIHRDLKPGNVMVENDTAKIMDFGLSDLEIQAKKNKGTLFYMAPEILQGIISSTVDIYSLGITFLEIISPHSTKQVQHSLNSISHLQNKKIHGLFQQELLKGVEDQRLQRIIEKMIAFQPHERYLHAIEIIEAINKECNTHYPIESEKTKQSYILGAGFVGRDSELALLKDFLVNDTIHCFLVYGDAGIGKTRLMAEMKKYCQLEEHIFLEANCTESCNKLYDPFFSVLNECLYFAVEDDIKNYGPEIKKLLPHHEKLQPLQESVHIDAKTEQRILIKNVSDFLLSIAKKSRKKIILYFNDIQWMDEGSLDIITALLFKIHRNHSEIFNRIKIFLSSRKEGLKHLAHLEKKSYFTKLELFPFDKNKIEQFYNAVFGKDSIGKKLRKSIEYCIGKIGGNPFYLQEIIRSLIASNDITRTGICWDLSNSCETIKIPSGIEELLLTRYKNLQITTEERHVLEIVSLLNKEVTFCELQDLCDCDLTVLQKLDYYEILKKEIIDNTLVFKIQHDLIKQMIIKEITDVATLHEHIAIRLELIHSNKQDTPFYSLAHHYFHGLNKEKALHYLEIALQKAIQEFEFRIANECCDNLLRLHPQKDKKRVQLLQSKIDINIGIMPIESLKPIYDELISIAIHIHDVEAQAVCYLKIGEAYFRIQEKLSALEYFEKSLTGFKQINDPRGIAHSLNFIGLYHLISSNNYTKAMEFHQESLKIGQSIGDELIVAYNIGNMGIIQEHLGDYRTALNSHKKATDVMVKINNKQNIALGYENIGKIYSFLGNHSTALEFVNKAIELANEIELFSIKVLFLFRKATILLATGDVKEAEKVNTEAFEYVSDLAMGDDNFFTSRIISARVAFAHDQKEKALEIISDLFSKFQDTTSVASLHYYRWKFTEEPSDRDNAIDLYRKLYSETSKFEYKKYIDELLEYQHLSIADDSFNQGDISEVSDQNSALTLFTTLKKELDTIHHIFQHTDLNTQCNLNETNELIQDTLLALVQKLKHNKSLHTLSPSIISTEQKRIDFFQKLLEIIHDLNSNLSLDILLDKILDASIFLMGADRGLIFLQNQEGSLQIKACRDNSKKNISIEKTKYSKTIVQKVLKSQQSIFIPDVADEINLSKTQSILDLELRSVMCAPIGSKLSSQPLEKRKYPFLSSSQKLGIIYIDSTNTTQSSNFIGSNLVLFQALVDQVSIAIVNALLYENVNIDELTGLFLRSYFETSFEFELLNCVELNSHVSVLMIDIDFFKLINDRFGHQVGDDVLRILGSILKKNLRSSDICGRYGGEEFIIILPNTELEQAVLVAQKIQNLIADTKFPSGQLTVSIGISSFPEHFKTFLKDDTRKAIIKNADQALYWAKDHGRNRYEVWHEQFPLLQHSRSSVKEILTGNPIRDYRNVEMLLDVIHTIAANIDKQDLLMRIIDLSITSFDADKGIILTKDDSTQELHALVYRTRHGVHDTSHICYSKKTVDLVLKTGKEICMNAVEDEFESQSIKDMEIKSIMAVPLYQQNNRIGVIYIDSKKIIKEFSTTELSFLTAIAKQISMLIHLTRQIA